MDIDTVRFGLALDCQGMACLPFDCLWCACANDMIAKARFHLVSTSVESLPHHVALAQRNRCGSTMTVCARRQSRFFYFWVHVAGHA